MATPSLGLFDPLILQSSFVHPKSSPPLGEYFWQKFRWLNFIVNICVPVSVLLFLLFALKYRYQQNPRNQLSTNFGV